MAFPRVNDDPQWVKKLIYSKINKTDDLKDLKDLLIFPIDLLILAFDLLKNLKKC